MKKVMLGFETPETNIAGIIEVLVQRVTFINGDKYI